MEQLYEQTTVESDLVTPDLSRRSIAVKLEVIQRLTD